MWSSNASVRKNPVSTQLRIPSIASGTSMSTESIANSILSDDNSVRNVNPVVTSSGTPVVTCSGIVSSAPARVSCAITDSDKNSKKERSADIRSREDKLRKKEEDIAIREAALREKELKHLHLETYIEKLEARNNELEKSIRLLKRRLSMFESDAATDGAPAATNVTTTPSGPNITTTPFGPNIPQRADRQTELVYKIHDRVTNFVLTKLDRELDALLQPQESTYLSNSVGNRSSVSHVYHESSATCGTHGGMGRDMCSDRDTIPVTVQPHTGAWYDVSHGHPSTSTQHMPNTYHDDRNGSTWSANNVSDTHSFNGPRQSSHRNINPQTLLGQPVYYRDQPFLSQARPTRPYQ